MAESISLKEFLSGTAALAAYGSEKIVFSESAGGDVAEFGLSNETLSFTEHLAGSLPILGASRESLSFSETALAGMWGQSAESISFAEFGRAVLPVDGFTRECLSFGEKLHGVLVETDDGVVWVVNLKTGGHSRYTGDLTGTTPVDAYVVTPVDQLGGMMAKHVPDAYLHLRCDGDMEITTVTDEQTVRDGYFVERDSREGVHRRRRKLARGIKSSNWQFKIANLGGADFTLKSMEVLPVMSQRVK